MLAGVAGWSCGLKLRAGVMGWSCRLELRAGVAGWNSGLDHNWLSYILVGFGLDGWVGWLVVIHPNHVKLARVVGWSSGPE